MLRWLQICNGMDSYMLTNAEDADQTRGETAPKKDRKPDEPDFAYWQKVARSTLRPE